MNTDKLLMLFDEAGEQFLSGESISRELGVSRTAVWKNIHKLQEQGYSFEASRKLGYRITGRPDPLEASVLEKLLETKTFGRKLVVLQKVDSTQNIAQQLAQQGAEEGTLVIAEQQLSGRGRMGRGWVSPFGKGIWMSMVLRPLLPVASAPQLTLLTAVALCRSLRAETGLDIGIKWPNDLLIAGRKISGILLESAAEDERLSYVVAGIGISVNLAENDYPEELLEKAVSLRLAAGREFSRTRLTASFLRDWEALYHLYLEEGFAPIRSLWEALSVSLNHRTMLRTPQGVLEGTPIGLHETGAIMVEFEDGTQRPLYSAEMGEPAST